jgi:hypothetical protein
MQTDNMKTFETRTSFFIIMMTMSSKQISVSLILIALKNRTFAIKLTEMLIVTRIP